MTIERPMFPPAFPRRQAHAQAHAFKVVAGTAVARCDREAVDEASLTKRDPTFRAIDAHRQAVKTHSKAVEVEWASEGKVTNAAFVRLQETTGETLDDLWAASAALVKTAPTTIPGAIAMLQYLATQFGDEYGSNFEATDIQNEVDNEPWMAIAFRTLAAGLMQVQP